MNLKRSKDWVREVMLRIRRKGSAFEDFPGSWMEAQAAVEGYAASDILEQVLQASLAVRDGQSVHERDAVNFDTIHYAWPVLAGLLWAAARNGGSLRVIDFGGSLGSSYRQFRRFLYGLPNLSWAIVEQQNFVDAGSEHFADAVLSFHSEVMAASLTRPNVGLLSGVLQYVDDPFHTLATLTSTEISTLVIDRTPVHFGEEDYLTIQHVPARIYAASYPARLLSHRNLMGALCDLGWEVLEEFETLEHSMITQGGFPFSWTGMICSR